MATKSRAYSQRNRWPLDECGLTGLQGWGERRLFVETAERLTSNPSNPPILQDMTRGCVAFGRAVQKTAAGAIRCLGRYMNECRL